jgi:hypothetical protein
MRWVLGLVIAVLATHPPASALAQESIAERDPPTTHKWLVLPAELSSLGSTDTLSLEALHSVSEAVRQDLALRGLPVWAADRATERFEAVSSAPAPEVSQTDIDRWAERSRAALRYLARADYKAARRELKAAQALADRAAEELNREAARAQQVLDTCLFMVRAYLETSDPAEAKRQTRECRQLVPRVEPSSFRHTPEVRDLLAEVDAEIATEAPGSLEVTSEPAGCLVRINGIGFGKTPLSGIELPAGTYRVQVECDPTRRGRIHRVAIDSGPNRFTFDDQLEQVVRTRPVLHLDYASSIDWDARMDHAGSVAEVLDGAGALAVSSVPGGVLRLDSNASHLEPASVWIPAAAGSPTREDVERAVDAILEGRSVDFTGPQPVARASWWTEANPVARPPESVEPVSLHTTAAEGSARPHGQRIAGWTTFGVGVASIGASVGLHVWRGRLGDTFVDMPSNVNDARRWNDIRIAVWTTAGAGGAAVSAAMPLLLPNHRRTPWWGWLSGAAGLGLTGYAVYEGVTLTTCPEPFVGDEAAARACVDRGQEAGRLSLALAGAAPLLTIPLVYLIRPLRAEPSVSVNAGGAVVKIRKAF